MGMDIIAVSEHHQYRARPRSDLEPVVVGPTCQSCHNTALAIPLIPVPCSMLNHHPCVKPMEYTAYSSSNKPC